jgi:hypothetical protein
MVENWPDWSNFRYIILTWYMEPYNTQKVGKISFSKLASILSFRPVCVAFELHFLILYSSSC